MKRDAIRMLGWLTVIMLLITQTMGTALARSFSGTSTINASNLEDGEKVTLKGYENTKLTINIDTDKTIESIQPETTDAGHIIFEGDDSYTLTISDGIKADPLAYVYGTKIEMKGGSLVVNNRLYAGDINISGGNITATGSYEAMHTDDLTVSGGSVSATATGSESVGINVFRADLDGGSVSASGDQAAIKPWGSHYNTISIIDLGENMGVISPAGGRVSDDKKSIITASGAVATAVKLGAVTKYPVWVGGTQVTSANKDDILGDGGKARFDSSTKTLTLNNPVISGMHEQAMIYALGIDLTAEGKATLNYAEAATAFNVAADGGNGGTLTLNGDFSISGSGLMSAVWADSCITVKGGSVTCAGGGWGFNTNGDIKIEAGTVEISSGFTGIRAANGNITISGGTVTATGSEEGTGDGAGISSGGKVEIANATVTAKGRVHGIAAGGDITIAGNRVTAETWVQNESQALRADGNLTISGGMVTTKTAATGIHSKGSIKIENGTEKVETDAKKHAASAGTALVIGDGLMIKEPAGGIIQEGCIYEAGGTTEATHALIVPKAPLPKVIGIKANVTGTLENTGGWDVQTDTLETLFASATAPVTMSTSFLYTDQACQIADKLTTAPVAGTPYYFVISIDAYPDTDPATLEWADNATLESGSTLTANKGTVEIAEFFHSPAGGSLSVICKYIETASPVPSWTVTFDANGHGTAPAAQTVTDGGTAVKPADPTETGWTFGGWYTDAACTAAFDFSTPVTGNLKLFAKWTEGSSAPVIPATYSVVSITNSAWTRGSGASVVITVKRSEADDTCFSHFTGVQIDGAALASGDYEAKAGSTVVTLKAATLQKLSAGNHTVGIHFDDGKAEVNLTVSEAANPVVPEVPKTGDNSPIGLWIALTVLSAAGLWALTGFGRKRRSAGRR